MTTSEMEESPKKRPKTTETKKKRKTEENQEKVKKKVKSEEKPKAKKEKKEKVKSETAPKKRTSRKDDSLNPQQENKKAFQQVSNYVMKSRKKNVASGHKIDEEVAKQIQQETSRTPNYAAQKFPPCRQSDLLKLPEFREKGLRSDTENFKDIYGNEIEPLLVKEAPALHCDITEFMNTFRSSSYMPNFDPVQIKRTMLGELCEQITQREAQESKELEMNSTAKREESLTNEEKQADLLIKAFWPEMDSDKLRRTELAENLKMYQTLYKKKEVMKKVPRVPIVTRQKCQGDLIPAFPLDPIRRPCSSGKKCKGIVVGTNWNGGEELHDIGTDIGPQRCVLREFLTDEMEHLAITKGILPKVPRQCLLCIRALTTKEHDMAILVKEWPCFGVDHQYVSELGGYDSSVFLNPLNENGKVGSTNLTTPTTTPYNFVRYQDKDYCVKRAVIKIDLDKLLRIRQNFSRGNKKKLPEIKITAQKKFVHEEGSDVMYRFDPEARQIEWETFRVEEVFARPRTQPHVHETSPFTDPFENPKNTQETSERYPGSQYFP